MSKSLNNNCQYYYLYRERIPPLQQSWTERVCVHVNPISIPPIPAPHQNPYSALRVVSSVLPVLWWWKYRPEDSEHRPLEGKTCCWQCKKSHISAVTLGKLTAPLIVWDEDHSVGRIYCRQVMLWYSSGRTVAAALSPGWLWWYSGMHQVSDSRFIEYPVSCSIPGETLSQLMYSAFRAVSQCFHNAPVQTIASSNYKTT